MKENFLEKMSRETGIPIESLKDAQKALENAIRAKDAPIVTEEEMKRVVLMALYLNSAGVEEAELVRMIEWVRRVRIDLILLELMFEAKIAMHFPVGNDEPSFYALTEEERTRVLKLWEKKRKDDEARDR